MANGAGQDSRVPFADQVAKVGLISRRSCLDGADHLLIGRLLVLSPVSPKHLAGYWATPGHSPSQENLMQGRR